MSETTRILWSGLTGRTGREAIMQDVAEVKIVAGVSRYDNAGTVSISRMGQDARGLYEDKTYNFKGVKWYMYDNVSNPLKDCPYGGDFDVIVDFSNEEAFASVLELAVRTGKPLISGTSGLSDGQIASLYDATNRIPVFRGGNFRFKVKKFIDEAVELAKKEKGRLDLYENFYKGKSLPSETSKVIQRRISEATGRTVEVHSSDTFAEGNLICDWELQVHRRLSPTAMNQEKVHCRTIGFDELAHDVLEIAKVMKDKPIKRGEFYDLDEIWDDIPASAKSAG